MRNAFIIISGLDMSYVSAPTARLLAVARALSEMDVQVWWLVNAPYPNSSIVNDPYYSKINFISLKTSTLHNKHFRILNYLQRIMTLTKTPSYCKRIQEHNNVLAAYIVGRNVTELLLTYSFLHHRGIRVLYERTEYPDLGVTKYSFGRLSSIAFYKCFLPKVDTAFVISTALKSLFEKKLLPKHTKPDIRILGMMVEPNRLSNSEANQAAVENGNDEWREIVYVGSMYGDKDGVYYLVEAFLRICARYHNSRLVLIGDSSDKEKMQRILMVMNGKSEANRIEFTGLLDRVSTYQRMASAYCLALARPNNVQAHYGFPNKLGEYLATGRPVVVTRVGDIPMYLSDGYNAFIAEPDNVCDFAEKLSQCLDNAENAAAIGIKGRELVYSVFNYYHCVRKVIYEPLLHTSVL